MAQKKSHHQITLIVTVVVIAVTMLIMSVWSHRQITLIVTVIVTALVVTMLIMSVWRVTNMLVMLNRSTRIAANITASRNLA